MKDVVPNARATTFTWRDLFGTEHTFASTDGEQIQKKYEALFLLYLAGKIRDLNIYS